MILPSGFAHVTISGAGTGMPEGWAFTFGVELGAAAGDAQETANDVHQALVTSTLMSNFQATVIKQEVLVKFGPTSTGPSASNNVALAGSAAGNQAPPNCSVLVHKNTAFGGRAGRGRMYLPPVNEGSVTADGLIDSALVAAIQTDMNAFFAALDGQDLHPVVLHGAGSPIATPSLITSLTVDGKIGTQRRRLRR